MKWYIIQFLLVHDVQWLIFADQKKGLYLINYYTKIVSVCLKNAP